MLLGRRPGGSVEERLQHGRQRTFWWMRAKEPSEMLLAQRQSTAASIRHLSRERKLAPNCDRHNWRTGAPSPPEGVWQRFGGFGRSVALAECRLEPSQAVDSTMRVSTSFPTRDSYRQSLGMCHIIKDGVLTGRQVDRRNGGKGGMPDQWSRTKTDRIS